MPFNTEALHMAGESSFVDQNWLQNLEKMAASDDLIQEAQIRQSQAIESNVASNAAIDEALENLRRGRVGNQSALEQGYNVVDRQNPLVRRNIPALDPARVSSAAEGAGAAARNFESGGVTRATTAPRPMNAPAPVRIPTAETTIAPGGGVMGNLGRAAGVLGIPAQLRDLAISGRNAVAGIQNIGNILTGNDEPVPYETYPDAQRYLDENESWRQNALESFERVNQSGNVLDAYQPSPVLEALRDFAAPITCALFGRGCDGATSEENLPVAGNRPAAAPPFIGGQSSGVSYSVTVFTNFPWGEGYLDSAVTRGVTGRITNIAVEINSIGTAELWVYHNDGASRTRFDSYSGENASKTREYKITSTNIERADGLPDTGGNPAPLPGAPPGSMNAPIVGNPLDSEQRPRNRSQTDTPAAPALVPSNPPDPATQPNEQRSGQGGAAGSPNQPPGGGNPFNPATPAAAPNAPATPTADGNTRSSGGLQLPTLPFIPPVVGRSGTPSRPPLTAASNTGASRTTTSTGTENPFSCSYDSRGISGKVDQTNQTLGVMQVFLESQVLAKVNTIDTKLGDQLPGGLGGYFKKFWQWSHMDRIMQILTLFTVIHNAQMLSTSISQSLFSAVDNIFQAFGFALKDDDGNDIDTSGWVGNQIEEFFKSIFGDQTVETVQANWRKWNKIYQAAANIMNAMQSILYSITEALEQVGKYVALIGNSLRRWGVVSDRAYGSMNTNPNFRQNKFFKVLDGLQEGVETLENISGEVLSITENVNEIREQSTAMKVELVNGGFVEAQTDADNFFSSSPPNVATVERSNLIKPED